MPREDVGMATCRPFFLWLATAAVASALLRQMKEAVLPLSVVAYSPMSLDVDRLDEIGDEFAHADVVFLPGTQRKSAPHRSMRRLRCREGKRSLFVEAGWKNVYGSNKAAGSGLILGRRTKEKHIIESMVPNSVAQGRGLAIRVKNSTMDMLVLVAYFPPQPTRSDQRKRYLHIVGQTAGWMQEVTRTGARTTPVLAFDLNDGLGVSKVGNTWERRSSSAVGEKGIGKEKDAGSLVKGILEQHGLVAVNTWVGSGEQTFHGASRCSQIDFICLPGGLLPAVEKAHVLSGKGKRLQLIPDVKPRGHLPRLVKFKYLLHCDGKSFEQERGVKWDADLMMEALGRGRAGGSSWRRSNRSWGTGRRR